MIMLLIISHFWLVIQLWQHALYFHPDNWGWNPTWYLVYFMRNNLRIFQTFFLKYILYPVEPLQSIKNEKLERKREKHVCSTLWSSYSQGLPHDHLLLDSAPNIGPLISRWELDKYKNCWKKSCRTSKILTLLYQQFLDLLISQRDMSGPGLGALSNNRWLGDTGVSIEMISRNPVDV
jgi:hypothetical protein